MNNTAVTNRAPVPESQARLQNRDVALRAAFPQAFDTSIKDELYERDDYPAVKFWYAKDWTECKKVPEGKIASRLRFLQDEDGEEMTEVRLNEIRSFLLSAFSELQDVGNKDILPKTWANGTKGRAVVAACHTELRRRFNEFTLCNGDWKARSLMIEWYPSWARNHLEDDIIEITHTVPAKRPVASESSKQSNKKVKVSKEEIVEIPQLRDPLYYHSEMMLHVLTHATAGQTWILMRRLQHHLSLQILLLPMPPKLNQVSHK